jgi:hypothetical protein
MTRVQNQSNCKLVSSGSNVQPQKREAKKSKLVREMHGCIQEIVSKMRAETKRLKEAHQGATAADQLQPDITGSINLNDSIKKMDANQLKQKIIILKDNMSREYSSQLLLPLSTSRD